MKTQAEVNWEEKYGGMTKAEYNATVSGMLSAKLSVHRERLVKEAEQREAEKKSLTYPMIVKAIPEALARIEKYKDMPKDLQEKKRASLNKKFDREVKFERESPTSRELWVSERLLKWMETDPEYLQAKAELVRATNDYSKYLAKKEEWEHENADIINAERIRSKREELMQADPETLKALGITPDPTFSAPKASEENDANSSLRNYLTALHPSASDAEIYNMMKLV